MSSPHPRTGESGAGRLVGEIVAGHELVRTLGVGGMGEVYLGKHQALGMSRAIKVIRADLCSEAVPLQRFIREAQILVRLQHNSIVQIIDFGTLATGQPFLVMEYIEGPNLEELVHAAPLPVPNALVALEQMALALHHAHAHNIIHRDLKPSNVLVRFGDVRQVKMIDFGLARILDSEGARITTDGHLIGAPAYMAPEQVNGVLDVTSAVDVYAFAGIAYRLISGTPPFDHKKRMVQMNAQLMEVPRRLSERVAAVPAFFDDLLLRCLAKDHAERPEAAEIAMQLGRHLRGGSFEIPTAGQRPRVELVEAPWPAIQRDVAALVIDRPPPNDPDGRGQVLANRVMSLVEEIATLLSTTDHALMPMLRLEASLCEQLSNVEAELAEVSKRLESGPSPELEVQRGALYEKIRTLHAQQAPLQRKMASIVEAYRPHAVGPIKALFIQIDEALQELQNLRRLYP